MLVSDICNFIGYVIQFLWKETTSRGAFIDTEISKIETFVKLFNSWLLSTTFLESSFLDIWLSSEYASGSPKHTLDTDLCAT